MNKQLIEETLTQIVEMDHQAALKEKELMTVEREREEVLRKMRHELEFEIMKTARKAAKAKVQELTQETQSMIDEVEKLRLSEINDFGNQTCVKKAEIVEMLFKETFQGTEMVKG